MDLEKTPDAFRSISEAAADIAVPQHVLRFWETRFAQVKPVKRAGGRRFYRAGDIDLLLAIKKLLHQDGYTIKGVQRLLKEKGGRALLVAAHGRDAGARPDEVVAQAGEGVGLVGVVDADADSIANAQRAPLAAHCTGNLAALQAALAEIAACQQILRSARGA